MQLSLLESRRRIDFTFDRLQASFDALPEADKAAFAQTKRVALLVVASRLRGMEMAEEDMPGHQASPLADAYDRVAMPGENAAEAVLRALDALLASGVRAP